MARKLSRELNNMSRILALEASTQAGSVAFNDGQANLFHYDDSPRNHTRTLLPFVDKLLEQTQLKLADLDALAFAAGPGSFTGLRIAAGVTQGLAYAAKLPVVLVSSLQSLAQAAIRLQLASIGDVVVACIDARMDEVYHAAFTVTEQGLEPLVDDELIRPENWRLLPGALVLLGDGIALLEQAGVLAQAQIKYQDTALLPHAQDVAVLAQTLFTQGKAVAAHLAEPVYLRGTEAWKTLEQQQASK